MVFKCDNLHHLESIMNEKLNSVFKYFNINKLAKILIKAGFFMIADDQGLQIADCKESCFHIIADDRERSQSRLLPTFRSAEVSKLQVLCACGKIASKQHSLATKSSQVFQLAFLISNLCLMDCVQYVDWAIADFEILLALHLAPIQKVVLSIISIWPHNRNWSQKIEHFRGCNLQFVL